MTFDPTKKVISREGFPARILCTDKAGREESIVALVKYPSGDECCRTFYSDGRYLRGEDCPEDLINIKRKVKRYMNIYGINSTGHVYVSRMIAENNASPSSLGIFEFEIEVDDE